MNATRITIFDVSTLSVNEQLVPSAVWVGGTICLCNVFVVEPHCLFCCVHLIALSPQSR